MDPGLKQRLIGAAVLIALAVIFLPMLVQGPAPDSGVSDLSLQVPEAPAGGGYVTRDLPLVVPEASGGSGLLADDGRLATVDTATAGNGGARPEDAADLAGGPGAGPAPDTGSAGPGSSSASEALPLAGASPEVTRTELPATDRAGTPRAADAPAQAGRSEPSPDAPDAPGASAAAAPATPRLPAATAGGDYAVNFGAYATRTDAGTVVQRLRGENLPAYVEETRVGGRDAWRVRIGPYASRGDAEAARARAGSIGSRAQATVVALDAAATPAARSSSTTAATPAAARVPDPAPAATPGAAAGTGFAVQVGAFASEADAHALRDRLRAAGITAFTDTVATDKGRLTRVKAGPVATRAEAEQLKARVKSGTGVDGLVRAHP